MIRNFLIYGLGGAASRLVAVFLVPLYTRTLDIAAYGQLEMLLALHALFVLVVGLQGESAVLRDYHGARDAGELPQLAWGAVALMACGILVSVPLAAIALAAGWLDRDLTGYLPLIGILTLLAQLFGIQLILIRFNGQPFMFAALSFADVLVTGLASVVLMVGMGWGIEGALIGMIAGKTLVVAGAWRQSFGALPSPLPSRKLIERMAAYALPTMPSVLLNWLQTNGTRVVLAIFLTFVDVALASVAVRVAALFGFLVYSFRLAWEPWAFRQLDLPDRDPDVFDRLLARFVAAMFVAAAVAIAVAPVAVAIFAPPTYSSSAGLLGFFVLGQLWLGIANITAIGVHGARVTSRLTLIFGAGGLVNLVLLALLSPIAGVLSAGIAFLVGAMVAAMLGAVLSERHYALRFSRRLLATSAAASGLLAGAAWLAYDAERLPALSAQSWWLPMAGMALFALILCAVTAVVGYTPSRRADLLADLQGFRATAKSAMARFRLGQR